MFTGIIQSTGTIVKTKNTKQGRFIAVKTESKIVRSVSEGGSVAIDGVCLTALNRSAAPRVPLKRGIKPRTTNTSLTFELMHPTLKRTTLGARKIGDRVNVEPAMLAGQPIGGHFISGHVDGVGVVQEAKEKWHTRYVVIKVPAQLSRYLVPQGSVVVNGVSLTLVEVKPPLNLPLAKGEKEGVGSFSVALTEYTQKHTNLGTLKTGDHINIEVDMLAKYLIKFLSYAKISHRRRGI